MCVAGFCCGGTAGVAGGTRRQLPSPARKAVAPVRVAAEQHRGHTETQREQPRCRSASHRQHRQRLPALTQLLRDAPARCTCLCGPGLSLQEPSPSTALPRDGRPGTAHATPAHTAGANPTWQGSILPSPGSRHPTLVQGAGRHPQSPCHSHSACLRPQCLVPVPPCLTPGALCPSLPACMCRTRSGSHPSCLLCTGQ